MPEQIISKVLSANDSGETGGHQSGLLIPRDPRILSFFPKLDASIRNPRSHLKFGDDSGQSWTFAYIYYNNRFFGGTRNEYRLTRMTRYLKEAGLITGDEVYMHRGPDGEYSISYRRKKEVVHLRTDAGRTVLKLGSGWKVIDI